MAESTQRRFISRVYRRAARAEDLPWHRDEPLAGLRAGFRRIGTPGRVLDVGGGAGSYAIWMAKQGWRVTLIDYLEPAVEMAERRMRAAGVEVDVLLADARTWRCDEPFDLVHDAGCLHMMPRPARAEYATSLATWLRPGGDFLLGHFERRAWWDWRPMGPTRLTKDEVLATFPSSLELELVDHVQGIERVPLPVGPTAAIGQYHLRRRA